MEVNIRMQGTAAAGAQDRTFIQGVIDAENMHLLRLLAESPTFDIRGCVPHNVLHLMDRSLLESLLAQGLDINARLPNTKIFLLHKVLVVLQSTI